MKTSTGILLFDVLLGGGIEQGKHYCLIGRDYNFSMLVLNEYFKGLSTKISIYDKSRALKSEWGDYNPTDTIYSFLKSLPDLLHSNKDGVLVVTLSGFDKSDMDKLSEVYVKHNCNTTLITLGGYTKTDDDFNVFNVTPSFQTTVKSLLKVDRFVWKGKKEQVEFRVKSYSDDKFRYNRYFDGEWVDSDSFECMVIDDNDHPILPRDSFDEVHIIMRLCRLYGLHKGSSDRQFFSFEPNRIFKNRFESAKYLYSNQNILDDVKLNLYKYISEEVR